jgi:hypothetical protein
MIITYAGPAGRQVVMADTNPGIGGLGATTALTLEEYRRLSAPDVTARKPAAREPAAREPAAGGDGGPRPVSWRRDRPPPNLGPPPQRLDWRRRRS